MGISFFELYASFRDHLTSIGYEYIASGSFRYVYRRRNVIVKIPRSFDGVVDNIIEAKAYSVYRNKPTSLGIILAPSKLMINYCLMMPHLKCHSQDLILLKKEEMPNWAYQLDAHQVGLRNGKIMAYDYALNMPERFRWEKELGIKSNFFHSDWKQCHPEFFHQTEVF